MIVVTTPTGQIGSRVVKNLLAANETIRVIARNADKLDEETRARVEFVEGSSDDEAVLMRAFDGAKSLFLLVPPYYKAEDSVEYYLQFARPTSRAIVSRGVKRVVSISGVGRGVPVNAGPVTGAFKKDEEIESTGVDFRALWCPGFMENFLRSVDSLRNQGMFFGPGRADVKMPQVAVRDIAATASRLLLDQTWTGVGGVGVFGPEDLSNDDMAAIMSEVLEKPVRYQMVAAEAYKAQLVKYGASEAFAQALIDMYVAKDEGLDLSEPRTAENTTPTSFRQWCEEVLKPAVNG